MEKLIRDKLENLIDDSNLRIEEENEMQYYFLERKLLEELNELEQSEYTDVYEYADVLEVLMSMAEFNGVDWKNVETTRRKKFEERGGFDKFLILNYDSE